MAKATMRPEVKAQKLKNNKTSHLPLKCSTLKCDNDSQIITGPFANRIRKCEPCRTNPQTATGKRNLQTLALLKQIGIL